MTTGQPEAESAGSQADRARILGKLTEIRDLVLKDAEFPSTSMPPTRTVVVGMLSRCLGLYKAAVLLLLNDLPDEALIIGRPLFEESIWLSELADGDDKRREQLVLGWLYDSLNRAQSVVHAAARAGLEKSTAKKDEALAGLEARRESVKKYQARHGIGEKLAFRPLEELARKFGRLEGWWVHEVAHQFVHGNELSHSFRSRLIAPNSTAFFTGNAEPSRIATVGALCAESVIEAHSAGAQLLERTIEHEDKLRSLFGDIQSFIEDSEPSQDEEVSDNNGADGRPEPEARDQS